MEGLEVGCARLTHGQGTGVSPEAGEAARQKRVGRRPKPAWGKTALPLLSLLAVRLLLSVSHDLQQE